MSDVKFPDASFRRLGYRAGIKRFESTFFERSRGLLDNMLEKIIRNAISYTQYEKKKTVNSDSVDMALKDYGINLGWKPRPKASKKASKKALNLNIYINKVLNQVHPNAGITEQSQIQLNKMMVDLINKYSAKSLELIQMTKSKTISTVEIETITKTFLPGEVVNHAVSEGSKAVSKYDESIKNKEKGDSMSKAERAGLTVAPPRVEAIMRSYVGKTRLGQNTSIYLAAVIEYLIAEILELAGNAARDNNRVRINDRFILLAIENDEELKELSKRLNFVLAYSGVIPHIHTNLLPHKRK